MSQLPHAQFPLRRHPDLLVDHRRARSAAVAEPRGANNESRHRLRWPASFRNGGRHQIGIPGRIASEFAHNKTVTLVAGLRLRGLVAQKAFDRPINAASFEEWVEKCLVPTLSKGDIVVMDNLSSHKGPRVEQLIKAAGAELRYLPPYSPDMNPIEKAYSKLKAFLRKIAERTVAGLLIALDACADIFKPAECVNYFKACGYDTG